MANTRIEAGKPSDVAALEGPYTAVVYVHGMGSQRRLEETSRLVDSLDCFLHDAHACGEWKGRLLKIVPRLESARDGSDGTVTYIRTLFRTSLKDDAVFSAVRFYEVYWAPLMAGQKSPIGVLRWLLRQVPRPIGTVLSPWRERQRLRRASLAALFEDPGRHTDGVEPRDFSTLVEYYDDFEGPAALRQHPRGTFDEFLAYLAERSRDHPATAERHARLARTWRRTYWLEELRNAGTLLTLALTMLLLACASVGLAWLLLQQLSGFAVGAVPAWLADLVKPSWSTAIGLLATVGALLGLGAFLTDYLGDVEAWATYEETNEKHERRAKVIEIGSKLLAHVLADERCERVVVVAHSLGTTIAHDTLLSLVRSNRARNPQDPIAGPVSLTKIEHFVTLGSPIDKIEYFFESYRSPFHRYRRVVEALRGDICTEPFCRNKKPFIHWINFWDDGDPVSGPLHSPAGHRGFTQRVDNVHVQSLDFPNPAASHLAYFLNRDVVAHLFEIIYQRAGSFCALPPREGKDRDWGSVYVGPAIDPPGQRAAWRALAAAVPWLALAGGLAWLLVDPLWAAPLWIAAGAAFAVILGGFVVARGGRPRRPLERTRPECRTGDPD